MKSDESFEKEAENIAAKREHFGSRLDGLLYCAGMAVGVDAVWRFPFLAFQNGGGAFVLAYLILMLVIGFPLFAMDVGLGQFASQGPAGVWKCLPIAKGTGYAQASISVSVGVYYNVLIAYALYYLRQSFRSVLPWEGCFDWWGADAEQCFVRHKDMVHCRKVPFILYEKYAAANLSGETATLFERTRAVEFRAPLAEYTALMCKCSNATMSAAEMFWERHVLELSSGIAEVGGLKWDLVAYLFVSWVLVYLCLIRGVSSFGKVEYIRTIFPFVIITILFIKGITLEGAMGGVEYFLTPKLGNLKSPALWRRAAEQLSYALCIGYGVVIMAGSHRNFHSRGIMRDSFIVTSFVFAASFLAGVAVFSVLGHMSLSYGIPIEEVAKQGQGLAFVVFPEALTTFSCPQFWSAIFFSMVALLGIDSGFPFIQVAITVLCDEFPSLRRHRTSTTFGVCMTCFLLGLSCVTRGGPYVLNLLDTYCAGAPVLVAAALEAMCLSWIYGMSNFSSDLEFMLGSKPNVFARCSWFLISPLALTFLVGYYFYDWTPIVYDNAQPYPRWADYLGITLAALPLTLIPFVALQVIFKKKSIIKAFQPEENWGPVDEHLLKDYKSFKASRNNRI